MSTIGRRDPLLAISRVLIGAIVVIFAFCAALLAFAFVALMTPLRENMLATLPAHLGPATSGAVGSVLALLIAMLVIAILFMRDLLRIVGSVEKRNPFDSLNADRLRRMGWLTVLTQVILLFLGGIANTGSYRQAILAEDAIVTAISALLLTLILFILARVFRLGAAMRDELEGTV